MYALLFQSVVFSTVLQVIWRFRIGFYSLIIFQTCAQGGSTAFAATTLALGGRNDGADADVLVRAFAKVSMVCRLFDEVTWACATHIRCVNAKK